MLLRTHHMFLFKLHMVGTSQQPKFDDRSLFKPAAFCLIFPILKSLKTNIFCKINVIFTINQFQILKS